VAGVFAFGQPSHPVTCANGLYRAGCVGPNAAPSPKQENWLRPGVLHSLTVGDRKCEEGWHQPLMRDWRGEWWWGLCVPDR
jgi:hypothetical protein